MERPGGSGANIACWIGHLGGAVGFAGRVGRPDAARQEAALRAHGVRPYLAVDAARPTGRTVAIVEAGGERSFYTDRGANLALCPADLPESLLDGCKSLHVSGHALFAAGPRVAALALMRAAGARGIAVSVDAGSVAYLRGTGAAALAAWARDAELCFANAAEATLLPPARPGSVLVVTDGANGARALRDSETVSVAAIDVSMVDGIGAGDAFVAGYLRCESSGLRERLSAGVAAASRAVATAGGRPSAAARAATSRPADGYPRL